jgi:hypothetical protein
MSNLKKGAGRPATEEQLERIANYIENPNAEDLPPFLQLKLELLTVINGFVNKYGGGKRAIAIIKKQVPELSDKQDRQILHLIRDCMLVFSTPSIIAAHARNKLLDDLYYAMELARSDKDITGINETARMIMRLTRADRPEAEQVAIPPTVIVMAPMATANVQDYIPTDFDAVTVQFEEIKTKIANRNEE